MAILMCQKIINLSSTLIWNHTLIETQIFIPNILINDCFIPRRDTNTPGGTSTSKGKGILINSNFKKVPQKIFY